MRPRVIAHRVDRRPSQAFLKRLTTWEDGPMRSDHETRRVGADLYADLEGRALGAVPGDMAGDVAGHLRGIARELRATGPGGTREAVSLRRVADALDNKAAIHQILMAAEEDELTMALLPDDLGELERVVLDLEQRRTELR
jgi:hypothetical protein